MVAKAEAVAAANEFVINDDGSVSDRGHASAGARR
jgi:hypothetical protein